MIKNKLLLLLTIISLGLWSCQDEDSITPPLTVGFENSAISLNSSDAQTTITLNFARALSQDATIILDLASNDITYGQNADYYTEPATESGQLTLNASAGASSVSFTLNKNDFNLEQEKALSVNINSLSGEETLANGSNASLNVIFTENPALASGELTVDMGGADQTHQVYIDLSTGEMTRMSRFAWDLAFYNESGEFTVLLNSGGHVMAREMAENDLNNISSSDIASFQNAMVIPNYDDFTQAGTWLDNPNGDFSEAVIGDISETDSDNNVFIISRTDGTSRIYKKIRIIRNGANYTLQYADIDDTSFSTAEISRNASYEFTYFSLSSNNIVDVAPKKDLWDITFTQYADKISAGPSTYAVGYKDYVVQNSFQVSAVEVSGNETDYDNFTSADISGLTFSNDLNTIGPNWRELVGFSLVLSTDVFFVVNDTNGNIYKLRFTQLTDPVTDERGFPAFEYERL